MVACVKREHRSVENMSSAATGVRLLLSSSLSLRCGAMRCDAMRCDAMRSGAKRCHGMRRALQCDAMRCDVM